MNSIKGTVKDGRIALSEPMRRWLAEFDAIPPLQMSSAEEADWQAARLAQRELERTSHPRADFAAPGIKVEIWTN